MADPHALALALLAGSLLQQLFGLFASLVSSVHSKLKISKKDSECQSEQQCKPFNSSCKGLYDIPGVDFPFSIIVLSTTSRFSLGFWKEGSLERMESGRKVPLET